MKGTELDSNRYQLDPHTLDFLVCPLTKTRLTLNADRTELISRVARVAFPIRSGVPLLCVDEARALTDEEFNTLKG